MRGFGSGSASLTNHAQPPGLRLWFGFAHQPRSATGKDSLGHRTALCHLPNNTPHQLLGRTPVVERSRNHLPYKTKIQYNQRLTNRSKARLSEPSLVRKNFNAEEI